VKLSALESPCPGDSKYIASDPKLHQNAPLENLRGFERKEKTQKIYFS